MNKKTYILSVTVNPLAEKLMNEEGIASSIAQTLENHTNLVFDVNVKIASDEIQDLNEEGTN